MNSTKVLIVEDNLLTSQHLKNVLENHKFQVLGIFDKGEDALNLLRDETPDIILMDIHLAGELDGIATAEKIQELHQIPIIYLSDHVDSDTVTRAKQTRPVNYLSKPFNPNDLLRALELAFFNANQTSENRSPKLTDRILVRTDNQTADMITYNDILYLEANRAYSHIITQEKRYLLSNSLKKVFDQFQSEDFIKVSRSHVININHITGMEGNIIKLGIDSKVQMSSNYREDVMRRINLVK